MSLVKSSLDTLSKKDTQSLLMFVLFRLDQIPELSVLSQLVYLLDEKTLVRLLKYFGGQTVTFPTIDELRVLIHILVVYKEVEIEGKELVDAIEQVPKNLQDEVTRRFEQVKEIMEDYSFVY